MLFQFCLKIVRGIVGELGGVGVFVFDFRGFESPFHRNYDENTHVKVANPSNPFATRRF